MNTFKLKNMKRYIMICAAALLSIICAQAESISVEDVVMDKGETKTVDISLTNSHTDLVSFQMDLYLPDGITLNKTGCSLSNRFGSSYELTIGKQSDGSYRLISTSYSLTPISGTSGTILTLSLTAAQTAMATTASIQNIRFVTSNSERITISNTSFGVTFRDDQTLSLSSLPSQTYGNTYTLPSQTDQGLPLTWTVTESSVAMVSGNVLTATGAGTTSVTATQAGNNSYLPFTKTYTLTVNPKSASGLTISKIAAVTYNGSAQTPAVTVKDGSTTLTSGTDYTVAYSNNINVGTATVTVTGKGNYTGTKTASFTINASSASNFIISDIAAVTYNGTAQTPVITVKDGSTTLTSGTDYTVAYSNNTNVGTATVTVTGIGNYTGTKTATFTINAKSASSLTISEIAAVTYNGTAQTPAVTVKDGSTTLTSGTDYTVAYSNNINAGTATVTVTGIGNYTGTKTANFTIYVSTIIFADANVKAICVAQWDTNGDNELSGAEAAAVTDLGTVFKSNQKITCFDELRYFTGLLSIESYAFYCCYGLTSVTIPNSVTSIDSYAFLYCGNLSSISVESGNPVYDSRNNCNAIIKTATNTVIVGCKNSVIPSSVTSIGSYAFYDCSGLTSVTIPKRVTSIGSYAFARCTSLTSISVENGNPVYDSRNNCNAIIKTATNTVIVGCKNSVIPSSVTSIGSDAFYYCSGLTSVTIPNSVTSIGSYAFYNCSGLTKVKAEWTTPVSIDSYVFQNSNINNAKLYVPKGSSSSYASASYWKTFKTIKEFPDGDVNEDGETDVVDVVDIARFVIETPSEQFCEFLADINSDNVINIADAVVLLNDILGNTQFAKPAFASRKAASDVLTLFGDGNSLSLQMEGNGGYSAFQFDLWLPTDMDMMQVSLNDARRQGHQLLYNKVGDGHYRVVALSTSGNVFNGTSGELLCMTLDDFASDDVRIDNIHFVTARGIDVPFETLSISQNSSGITTGISSSQTKEENAQPVYNLNGQRLNAPRKGLNIIGGKKIVVK